MVKHCCRDLTTVVLPVPWSTSFLVVMFATLIASRRDLQTMLFFGFQVSGHTLRIHSTVPSYRSEVLCAWAAGQRGDQLGAEALV